MKKGILVKKFLAASAAATILGSPIAVSAQMSTMDNINMMNTINASNMTNVLVFMDDEDNIEALNNYISDPAEKNLNKLVEVNLIVEQQKQFAKESLSSVKHVSNSNEVTKEMREVFYKSVTNAHRKAAFNASSVGEMEKLGFSESSAKTFLECKKSANGDMDKTFKLVEAKEKKDHDREVGIILGIFGVGVIGAGIAAHRSLKR